MSVLIRGMEMPTICSDCRLMADGWCYSVGLEQREKISTVKRPTWCPLVQVPKHGRLIDEQWLKDAMIATLEALKKNPKMDKQEMHLIAAFDTLRAMVEDAPTIIPAEEGE